MPARSTLRPYGHRSPGSIPITVEVIGAAMASIVEETGEALIRASHSTNIKERRDCSTALFNAARRDAVPGRAHPDPSRQLHRHRAAHHAALPDRRTSGRATPSSATTPTRAAARICPTSCSPSRSSSTASIVAWTVNLAHHADFADRGHAHIYQEGLRIPPVRLYRGRRAAEGRAGPDPAQLPGAARAPVRPARADGGQPASACSASRRCAPNTAPTTVLAAGEALHGLCRAQDARRHRGDPRRHLALRGRVRQRGGRRRRCRSSVEVTVDGDDDVARTSTSPPQVRAGINMTYTALLATVYYAVKSVVDPTILPNAGLARPLTSPRREGSILNCTASRRGQRPPADLPARRRPDPGRAGPGGARAGHGLLATAPAPSPTSSASEPDDGRPGSISRRSAAAAARAPTRTGWTACMSTRPTPRTCRSRRWRSNIR